MVVLEAGRCGTGRAGATAASSPGCGRAPDAERGSAPRGRDCSWPRPGRRSTRSAPGATSRASTPGPRGPHLVVSAAAAQDGATRSPPSAATEVGALSAAGARVCASPVFRGGVGRARGATVQPARLAFGLRERRWRAARGRRGHACAPRSAAAHGPAPPWPRRTAARSGRAPPCSRSTPPRARWRRCARRTVASSHIVLTEPVPDVLEGSAGPAARRSPTAGRCCTTSAPRRTGASRSAGAAGAWPSARAPAGAGGRPRRGRADAPRPRALLPGARRPRDRARLGRADRRLPHPPAAVRGSLPLLGLLARRLYTGQWVGRLVDMCRVRHHVLYRVGLLYPSRISSLFPKGIGIRSIWKRSF